MIKLAAFGVQGSFAFWVFSFITFLVGFALASIIWARLCSRLLAVKHVDRAADQEEAGQ